MTLQARLDRIRESFEKDAPSEAVAVMHRVTDDLRASGIMDGIIAEGESAPDFTLDDTRGHSVTLSEVRSQRPVILTFFRGDW
jgi:hypothetical protein